jgi:hypothetical protein
VGFPYIHGFHFSSQRPIQLIEFERYFMLPGSDVRYDFNNDDPGGDEENFELIFQDLRFWQR